MNSSTYLFTFFVFLCAVFAHGQGHYNNEYPNKVLEESIKTLTFERGKMTTGRRSSPISQLIAIGNAAGSQYEPNVIQCYNMGSDGSGNIQWKCEAELEDVVRLGKLSVMCEGFDYRDDPYVLAGSCGLEYELVYTSKYNQPNNVYNNRYETYRGGRNGSRFESFIFLILIISLAYVCYHSCSSGRRNIHGHGYGHGNGYGGGAGGGSGQPPYNPEVYPDPSPNCGGTPQINVYPSHSYSSWRPWRPGFFSGLALGSFFNRPRYATHYGNSWGGGGRSSWGGGGRSSWSGGGRSSGSSTRTSTGFGRSSRR